jgi:zinc/manganese transport system permease protein
VVLGAVLLVIARPLLFGLLAAPAAAGRLTDRPWRALAWSVVLAVAAMWLGLGLAFAVPTLPPSFTIMAVAAAEYLAAVLVSGARRRVPRGAAAVPA